MAETSATTPLPVYHSLGGQASTVKDCQGLRLRENKFLKAYHSYREMQDAVFDPPPVIHFGY
ncbi:MAG: hypothetical protein M9955_03395 [Rhizobiaceae bacterium]|nr:hypothetical protein [Rhizobiaceae bacterium]